MTVKIDRLKEDVPYRIPRHRVNSKKYKSTFIDRNAVSTIKMDLGHFDYDALQQDKNDNIQSELIFNNPSNENIDIIKPVSSFLNEPSGFYNEEHDKMFSKEFQLVKRKK